ncbi:MAG TPA: hypothetical protein VKU41_28345, partial [Polyangiaceae bacterium]|nr:hypothetical protein [Polyangiaceae bacterium]
MADSRIARTTSHARTERRAAALIAGSLLAACGANHRTSPSETPAASDGGAAEASRARAAPTALGVTADWLDHRLTVFDFGALVGGATSRDAVLVGEVDLSSYTQGPLELKITPDGKTAIVSVSPGFFTVPGSNALVGASSIPTGPSKELLVNLATRAIDAELDVGDGPSGIALTGDGARTFAVADMRGTLSAPINLGSDAAGVPFFPGTKTAYVVLAYNPLTSPTSGYALIDASGPNAPVLVKKTAFTDATYVNFQAIAAPARGTVLVPISTGGELSIREYALGASDVVLKDTFDVGPVQGMGAFGTTVDPAGHAVVTLPADKKLAVLDLNTRRT